MSNPAIWLSLAGIIYALCNLKPYNDNQGWLFFMGIIFVVSVVYSCVISEIRRKEKISAAKSALNYIDGYIDRTIPSLNIFFNMMFGDNLYERKAFFKGEPNEVVVKLHFNELTNDTVDKHVNIIKKTVQYFFDTNFELPPNFVDIALNTMKNISDPIDNLSLTVFLAHPWVSLRPKRVDVLRFHKAVFIVKLFVENELFAVRTFHVKPNKTYQDAKIESLQKDNEEDNED
uniref:Uncharacterized protein n=1 Tax=uncultured Elusimicrobia bacterium TaxID=699876 RepID=A0A650EP20_9BACT|nr:hypothetical protein Elusimicrob1349_0940 [uncultured Elusimicrobia bacterium]